MADRHFTEAILKWYQENRRSLPWRGTTDPYPVWLSEIILQQTRIAQGQAFWERFMERFPTVRDLANASEDEVLRLWQGLGYYSRARNLHAAAKQIAAAGRFPDTLDGIRALKGVGDYTAAAIGSIAFGLPAAVVDGNVYRVLARYFGIAEPIGTPQGKKIFTARAQELLPPGQAADFNQGMAEKGRYAVIIVDALNEGLGCGFWNQNLGALRSELGKHSHIKLIVSVRSPFDKELSDLMEENRWTMRPVAGFVNRNAAVDDYFRYYDIERHYRIQNLEAFQNPLFLKMFC